MSSIVWVFIYVLAFLFQSPAVTCSSSVHNASAHTCHIRDCFALLQFKNGLKIADICQLPFPFGVEGQPKTVSSWRNGTDCCKWDGVQCDPLTGRVTKLDLSYSRLQGTINSSSSLFLLHHLRSLNLASNYLNGYISPNFGRLPFLKYLNLSASSFSGKVPSELAHLSQLTSLDLSGNLDLEMPNFGNIIGNLTQLRQLHLNLVEINSVVPQSLTNLSSLTSLSLASCSLRGSLPHDILNLPHLQVLILAGNDNLFANFSAQSNWSSPLVELEFSYCNFTGQLPSSIGQSMSLRSLTLGENNFYGLIPIWIWNTTESIYLMDNSFTGELPSSVNLNMLSVLTHLNLRSNLLDGAAPSWLFSLPSLQELSLDGNKLTGELPLFVNHSRLSSLQGFSLSQNLLNGTIPSWLYALPSLDVLDLSNNRFTGQISELMSKSLIDVDFSNNNLSGTFDLDMFSMLTNLSFLSLSGNRLSVVITTRGDTTSSSSSWSHLETLHLSSCNLSKFPEFLGVQELMADLDLSNNRIHGEIPKQMKNLGNIFSLNLSYNYLTGGLEHLPFIITVVDVRFNLLEGLIPDDIFGGIVFLASNNRLSGEIPLSICSSIFLRILDFSNNNLSGEIPTLLFNSSYWLAVVDLRCNKLHGNLPSHFGQCDQLATLDLNGNQLEGPVPKSLARCRSLEVLDLGNNKFNGTFPNWLDSFPELKVLILRNNSFHGVIGSSKVKHPFPKLQIADLSHNNFIGKLPTRYIKNFKAIINFGPPSSGKELQYVGRNISYGDYYQDSVVLTIKGLYLEYKKILTIFTVIDLSNNRFSGKIFDSIGRLVSLIGLNLSHNNLTGEIPQSLCKLTTLESLDLSSNMLTGEILGQLASLTSLEFFNVSENQLVGHIPQGKQFNTFSKDSYLENPGLCGFPLPDCRGPNPPKPPAPSMTKVEDESESTGLFEWEIILMGYGCGLILGLLGGFYMFSLRRPICLVRLIYRAEYQLMEHLKKHFRKQRQRRN